MGVKYRLSYCNEDLTPLRLDIEDASYAGEVISIEGGSNPFSLSKLNNEEFLKLGTIRATEARMEIISDANFNIDLLADSGETKLHVKYYFDNVLEWQGFILPDFYQETISETKIINLTATDRLGVLKDIAFPNNYADISLLDIIKTCLSKTGLSMNLVTLIGYNAVGASLNNRPLEVQVIGERLFQQGGDSLNCYDVLMSVLDIFNCFITQQNGKWLIVNKQQLESGLGQVIEYSPAIGNHTVVDSYGFSRGVIPLDEVDTGGERLLRPVLSDVSILGEFGGSILYPKNNNFRIWNGSAFANWTPYNGFVVGNYVNNPISYNSSGKINSYVAGDTNKLDNNNTLPSLNTSIDFNTQRYIQSSAVPVVLDNINDAKLVIDYSFGIITRNKTIPIFAIILETTNAAKKYYLLNGASGVFEHAGNTISSLDFRIVAPLNTYASITKGWARLVASLINNNEAPDDGVIQNTISGSGSISADEVDDLTSCKIYVRIYNVGDMKSSLPSSVVQSIVTNVKIDITSSKTLPKGNLYRATRSGDFTAKSDIKTAIFGDYITSGLNGYFYSYPTDDSSIIKHGNLWTTNYDSEALPVLQHTVRQISRLYGNVQSDLRVAIKQPRINVLDLFNLSCKNESYIISNYTIDFLRSQVSLTLSQIKSVTNPDKEYIYSYFGNEGGTTVSGLSSINGGNGSGSGSGSQNLQQVLDRGNEGGKIKIMELMVIPSQAPSPDDMVDEALYIDDSGVDAGVIDGRLESLSDVDITTKTDGYVVTWDSASGRYKLKPSSGGGGSGTVTSVGLSAPTGFVVSNSPITSNGVISISFASGYALPPNSKQMQWDNKQDALIAGTGISIVGNTISATGGGGGGSLSSVGLSMPTGFSVTNAPLTADGTIAVTFASGYSVPTTTKQSNWDTAYSESHTHSNKPYLDTINQNLSTTSDVTFSEVVATDRLRIPSSAPTSPQNNDIYKDDSGVNPSPIDGTFEGLDDVEIDTPTNGQVPTYNSTTNKWENKTPSGGGGGVTQILHATTAIALDTDTANSYIEVDVSSDVNCTILTGVALSSVFIEQSGSGKITFLNGSGVTMRKMGSKVGRTIEQYNVVEVFYKTATEVILKGVYE